MHCPCKTFQNTGSGGVKIKGMSIVEMPMPHSIKIKGKSLVLCNQPGDGFTAIWPLNEDATETDGVFADETIHGFDGLGGNGILANYPVQSDDGIGCQPSQASDGTQFASIPGDDIPVDQGFAVSFWVKLDGKFQERGWFSRGTEDWTFTIGCSFLNHAYARLRLVNDDDEIVEYAAFSNELSEDDWFHIACSWVPGGSLKIFVDGVQKGQIETTEVRTVVPDDGFIGRFKLGITYKGNLLDVRLHPEERSAAWWLAEKSIFCGQFYSVDSVPPPWLA